MYGVITIETLPNNDIVCLHIATGDYRIVSAISIINNNYIELYRSQYEKFVTGHGFRKYLVSILSRRGEESVASTAAINIKILMDYGYIFYTPETKTKCERYINLNYLNIGKHIHPIQINRGRSCAVNLLERTFDEISYLNSSLD